jgi:hypothetical protein
MIAASSPSSSRLAAKRVHFERRLLGVIAVGIAIFIGIEAGAFQQGSKAAGRDRAVGAEQDDDLLEIGPAIAANDQKIGGQRDNFGGGIGKTPFLDGKFERDSIDASGDKIRR